MYSMMLPPKTLKSQFAASALCAANNFFSSAASAFVKTRIQILRPAFLPIGISIVKPPTCARS